LERDLEALRLEVSFGVVCRGPLCDYAKLKDFVRNELRDTRLIYSLPSTRPLYLVKEVKENERENEKTISKSETGK